MESQQFSVLIDRTQRSRAQLKHRISNTGHPLIVRLKDNRKALLIGSHYGSEVRYDSDMIELFHIRNLQGHQQGLQSLVAKPQALHIHASLFNGGLYKRQGGLGLYLLTLHALLHILQKAPEERQEVLRSSYVARHGFPQYVFGKDRVGEPLICRPNRLGCVLLQSLD
eukprot:scaffold2033_cov367-Prasinococcus_capsulatus_cf.AAC.24